MVNECLTAANFAGPLLPRAPSCRLFESEGTTFTDFVLEQRLTRSHRMLTDPRCAASTVSALALEAGFGDVSYFNRCFRRRFGAAPSEIRDTGGRAMALGRAADKPD